MTNNQVDYYQGLCQFCENSLILQYICEDCNAVFCADCLKESTTTELVCNNCGGANISKDKNDKFYCKECKSETIVSVQKTQGICPNCAGSNVMKITEKAQSIKEKFKKIIIETRNYLEPLSEKAEIISNRSHKLIGLREDIIKMYHFPELELKLLQLVKLFDNIKTSVEKKTVNFYEEINRNLKYFYNTDKMPPKTLPIVTAIADTLQKTSNENLEFIMESIARLEERLNSVNMKLNFMRVIKARFLKFSSLLKLSGDEKPVFGIECKLDYGENEPKVEEYSSKKGTILLTNKKLYFFHEKGFRKKKTVLLFTGLLVNLQSVHKEGMVYKKLALNFATGIYRFKLSKGKRSRLINFIAKARVFDNNKVDVEALDALKRIKITIKPFRDSLEDAIYTIVNLNARIKDTIPQNVHSDQMEHDVFSGYIQDQNQPVNSDENGAFPHLNKWFGITPRNARNSNYGNAYRRESLPNTEIGYFSSPEKVQRSFGGYNTVPVEEPYVNTPNQIPNDRNNVGYLYETYRKRPIPPNYIVTNGYNNYEEQRIPQNLHNGSNRIGFQNENVCNNEFRTVNQQVYAPPGNNFNNNWNRKNNLPFSPNNDLNAINSIYNMQQKLEKYKRSDDFSTRNNISARLNSLEDKYLQFNSDPIENSIQKEYFENSLRNNNYGRITPQPRSIKNENSNNSLMSVFPKVELKKPIIPRPKREYENQIHKVNLSKFIQPRNFAEEKLKLEEKKYGIRRTLERLEIAQKNGQISENEYLHHYQELQGKIWTIQKQIEKINIFVKKQMKV
ncbi:MAG: hypothetical protein ACTSWY_01980 [Promethearchaeota archaeon]